MNYYVLLLHHCNGLNVKTIGIFDSFESVNRGIEETRLLNGFVLLPNNFIINRLILNRSHWKNGFEGTSNFPASLTDDVIESVDLPIEVLNIKEVYCLTHSFDVEDQEEIRYIGVYSAKDEAEKVILELNLKQGFSDHPEGFNIDRFLLNKREWKEGFLIS